VKDEDYETAHDDDDTKDDYKPTGQKRVLTVAKVDGVPETRHNMEIILTSLNLPDLGQDFQMVCDLKLCNIILGIQSCTALHGCPFCDGNKFDDVTEKPTNGRGRWGGEMKLRTSNSITANQSEWVRKTNSDRKQLKHYNSCEFKPIPLRKYIGDQEVIFQFPPDPLHVNLPGPVNDALEKMENIFPQEMQVFYKRHCLNKSGQGPGGQFNGPSIKDIIKKKTT
jgi:hypothetical protein